MKNVIDFISIKKSKQSEQLEKVFRKGNSLKSPIEINKLVEEKSLVLQDHKLFLAFLGYLRERKIEPSTIFKDVLKYPKHQFEQKYEMKWSSVVQFCFTFLTILKENDPKQYELFITNISDK
ncbi:hypothetical protein U5N28_10755 [Lysinibacillus telephonicus]|uniref:Uncharacterized protein n=1 Tax=Lysinibacillus telephonicus TaxID=1714840 RepID=A0A3S0HHV3_9BACI|nr:hypothetical protein [Lysinibacillus telephonicus]RTQ92097.1 hypothetical protein EKG35_12480 [Lysinibacillus telephonicus]